MQIWAFNQDKKLISAHNALRKCDYQCIECQKLVRLRAGIHRRPHFYHLELSPACRLNGKSAEHLEVQYLFMQQLTPQDCILEMRFPEINRIADVVWVSKKIIFEVQCSAISSSEVSARINDYASLGYEVIWILHDNHFNKDRLTSAENFLSHYPHYFTNINSEGQGIIYDQFCFIKKNKRINKSKTFTIEPNEVFPVTALPRLKHSFLMNFLFKRFSRIKIYFKGDIFDCLDSHKQAFEQQCETHERKKSLSFLEIYKNIFHFFLENFTR